MACSTAQSAVETLSRVQGSMPEHDVTRHRAHWNIWVTKKEIRIPGFGTRILEVNRRGRDSNPRDGYPPTAFRMRLLQPLGHLSKVLCHNDLLYGHIDLTELRLTF